MRGRLKPHSLFCAILLSLFFSSAVFRVKCWVLPFFALFVIFWSQLFSCCHCRGLAVGGSDGVAAVINSMTSQLRNDMAHAGVRTLSDVNMALFDVAHKAAL